MLLILIERLEVLLNFVLVQKRSSLSVLERQFLLFPLLLIQNVLVDLVNIEKNLLVGFIRREKEFFLVLRVQLRLQIKIDPDGEQICVVGESLWIF